MTAATSYSPDAAKSPATKPSQRVRIEELTLVKPGDLHFELLSNMVEGAICAFQSLGSSYTLPKKLTLDTVQGPISVLMGHTETVPYAHDPCAWCVKFRPQDLSAHEHIQVHTENPDLPILGDESYPDVVIWTPYGTVYAWEEIAISPDLDIAAACKMMSTCEADNWTEIARLQLEAQLTTFRRIEPESADKIQVLQEFYERYLTSEDHDPRDIIDFVKLFEDYAAQEGGIGFAIRYFRWIETAPQKGRSIQDDLLYTYPF